MSDSESDSENCPLFASKTKMSGSSSDSESDVTPPKQARKGRTVRGLGRLLKQNTEGFVPVSTSGSPPEQSSTSDVYSTQVQQSIVALREGKLNINKAMIGEDIEDETLFKKKKSATSTVTRASRYKSEVLEDEEDVSFVATESSQNSFSKEKSPTPPPTPDMTQVKKKSKRKMKGVKAAMKALDSVYEKYQIESKKKDDYDDDDVCIVDFTSPTSTRILEEKKDLLVKVRSRSGIQRFTMKKTEDFSSIFREMAAHEMVKPNQVSICHHDAPIQPYDTPSSINLTITDILDCYIDKKEGAGKAEEELDDPDVIHITVQGKDPRSKHLISLNKLEPLERMMRKYASKVGVPYKKLTFHFDGEDLTPGQTADQLDLEDEFCVDVTGV